MSARRRERGFTLIEIVAVIAVTAVIGTGVAALLVIAVQAQAAAIDIADVQDAGTLASDLISMELLEMRAPPSLGLLAMSASELHFVHWSGKRIRYFVSSGTLFRTEDGGVTNGRVASGVSSFQVVYRRRDGTAATAAADVKAIDFRVTVVRGSVSHSFGGQVYPRASDSLLADWREE